MTKLDLSWQIRELIDAADPVTADEAILLAEHRLAEHGFADSRAQGRHATFVDRVRLPVSPAGPPRSRRWGLAVGAGAVVLAVAVAARVAGSPGSSPGSSSGSSGGEQIHPAILSAQEVSDITTKSALAMADSGTAEVSDITTQDGAVQSDDTTAVTFEGANLDEKRVVTSPPGALGGPDQFTVDDRAVDGQFYIDTPGPHDVTRWYHDTGQDNGSSMSFPDPRTLAGDLSPDAVFEVVGTTVVDGETLTHLHARDPQAIDAPGLAGFTTGKVTAFDLWVDQDDVVRRLALSSSQTTQACTFLGDGSRLTAEPAKAIWNEEKSRTLNVASLPPGVVRQCGAQTTAESVGVSFANLGAPESVTAPAGAIDFAGKG